METIGADSFNKSIKAGHIVGNQLSSIAKTLGAPSVAPALMGMVHTCKTVSEILPDKDAVEACIQFGNDHAFLMEPSCGVSLAPIYKGVLPEMLENGGVSLEGDGGPIDVIVCGGSDTSVEILSEFARAVGIGIGGTDKVKVETTSED